MIGVAAVAQIVFGIYMSHKLAGPVVNMTRVMEKARSGDYSVRVNFRSGDDLEELSVKLNTVLETLDSTRSREKTQLKDIGQILGRLKRNGADNPEELIALRASVAKFTDIEVPTRETCSGQERSNG